MQRRFKVVYTFEKLANGPQVMAVNNNKHIFSTHSPYKIDRKIG